MPENITPRTADRRGRSLAHYMTAETVSRRTRLRLAAAFNALAAYLSITPEPGADLAAHAARVYVAFHWSDLGARRLRLRLWEIETHAIRHESTRGFWANLRNYDRQHGTSFFPDLLRALKGEHPPSLRGVVISDAGIPRRVSQRTRRAA